MRRRRAGWQTIKENIFAASLETARNAIAQLREVYDFFMLKLAAAIKQMRELRENNLPDEPERLKPNNKLEESEVYLRVEMLLNPSELANLNERMQKELDNLPPSQAISARAISLMLLTRFTKSPRNFKSALNFAVLKLSISRPESEPTTTSIWAQPTVFKRQK